MSIQSNLDMTLARIREMLRNSKPNSEKMVGALTRIGTIVATTAKFNIDRMGLHKGPGRRKVLRNTSNLYKSIRYELYQTGDAVGVAVGSFGVPYAAVHEFGFHGIVNVREHKRLRAKVALRNPKPNPSTVRAHTMRMNIRERSYLRPAVISNTDKILDILREALTG